MQTIRLLNTNIRYILQDNIKLYCLADIASALDYNTGNGAYAFYKHYKNQVKIQFIILSSAISGYRRALFMDDSSLKFLLSKSRKPKVPELIRLLGYSDILAAPTKEAIYVEQLQRMFPSLKFKEQYLIDKFRVDLYSSIYNIIVECDEHNHICYDYKKDINRTQIINNILKNPIWIKFNPDEKDFTVISLIAQITTAMTVVIKN